MLPPVDSEDVSMHISLPTHLNSYREALGMLIQVSVRIAYEEEVIDWVFLSTPFFSGICGKSAEFVGTGL